MYAYTLGNCVRGDSGKKGGKNGTEGRLTNTCLVQWFLQRDPRTGRNSIPWTLGQRHVPSLHP